MALRGKTVCVDFDGVIHSYKQRWTGLVPEDPPEPGALEFVNELIRQDATVVVFTTRGHYADGHDAVKAWLLEHDFPTDELTITDVKPTKAIAFVDDRAVHYEPGSGAWPGSDAWGRVLRQVEELAVRK